MVSMKNKPPIVSVVIVTLNEEKHIGNCLKSIIAQTYPQDRLEIIVVDNASTDRTVLIAKKYTRKVYNKGPQRSAQRNYGHSKATGKFFLYLDADMSLSPKVIKSCVQHMTSNPSLAGLYIPEIVAGNSYWSRVRRFERSFYDSTVIDCVRFLRTSVFQAVGGFDVTMTGPEDWDFDKKVRFLGPVRLITEPLYHNESEFDLRKYLAKKSFYAKSFSKYINKWGKEDPDVKKQFNPFYRLVGVFVENRKWLKVIASPHLYVGVLFLRILVGLSYIETRTAN